jgi:putative ABC transport system permease protein
MREFRAGGGSLIVFVLCIALGVAAVAAIGSLAASFDLALAQQGRTLVGGDLSIERVHQPLNEEERAAFEAEGTVSASASLRAMARTNAGKSALIETKAVDGNYPLFGEVVITTQEVGDAPWRKQGVILAERALLDRLGLDVGSRLSIGDAEVEIGGILGKQPDRLADRLAYGPRVLMSLDTLDRTNLVQPGSIIRWIYRLKLDGKRGDDRQALQAVRTAISEKFPQSGFQIRDWTDPAPSLRQDARRFNQFIGLVGLTALLLGGIGVGSAIGGYMARKREIIATFKCLGATSRLILLIYLVQTLLLASLGIGLGVLLGALAPIGLASLYGDVLPIALATEPHPLPLLTAGLAGLLTLALFVLWPLGKAARVPAAVLMRAQLSQEDERPAFGFIAASAASGILLFAVAIAASEERAVTASICAGIVAGFALFLGFGAGLQKLADRFRRTQPPALALALASIAGPGSLARTVSVSLGAGLGLLVAVALIHNSLTAEMRGNLIKDAPAYYFLDVDANDLAAFRDTAKSIEPDAKLADAPMLRGRIVAVKGVPADKVEASPDYRWVLTGDRGITYTDEIPQASEIVEGEWWSKTYSGPPLVSFDVEAARGLGLGVGDTVTVNILGRNVEARIASVRKIDWESLAINFVMVFSPNTLADAPHRLLTTLELPKGTTPEREGKLIQALAERFPLVTAIKVGDIIDAAKELLGRIMTAISMTAGFTLLIGVAVLASAIAASQQRRKYQAVLYKTLGATRRRIVGAELLEFGLLGFAVAVAALLLATLTAYALCRFAFDIDFTFSATAAGGTVLLALALVLGLGAIATWRVLSAKAATYLREA